ncbi:hypothetical protein BPJM79_50197 [Bacillus pumilus]
MTGYINIRARYPRKKRKNNISVGEKAVNNILVEIKVDPHRKMVNMAAR